MPPRTWFCSSLLLVLLLTACQPIRPIEATPTVPPTVSSTTTTGQSECPRPNDEPLDFVITPQWQAGQSHRYQVSYGRTQVEDGEDQPTITTSYAMSVTVLEANDAGYLLEWRYIVMIPGPRKVRLEYHVSPYGEFIAVNNLAELAPIFEAIALQLLLPHGDPLPARGTISHRALMRQAEALLSSDAQAFHGVYGLYFTDKSVFMLGRETLIPIANLRGTDTIIVHLQRYGAAQGCLNLFLHSEWQAQPGTLAVPYTITSSAIFDLDLNTGWPERVILDRSNIIDGEGQREEITVTRVTE